MKHTKQTFLFCLIALFSQVAHGTDRVIHIAPGHQQVVSIPNVTTVSIGNPSIATVNDPGNGNQVMITGKREGTTNLIAWTLDGQKQQFVIEVKGTHRSRITDIRNMLDHIEGIEISKAGNMVLIEGELFRGSDLEKVSRVTTLYENVKNYTKVHPKALEVLEKALFEKLVEEGFDQIKVTRAGDHLYLEGYCDNELQKTRAEKIAQNMYFQTESHLKLGVASKSQIWVDVQFMEVMNDKLDDIGVAWPDKIDTNTSIQAMSGRGVTTQLRGDIGVTLNTLVQNGKAKVLSNPKLLVRDGKKATFDAGGEIPIRLISERTANVVFKSYGLHLEIDAQADQSNRVFLDIQSRISDLDMSTSIDGLPGIVEHKINTAVDLEYGQTVALAGLIEHRQSKTTKKFPFLGHIPILGELFKSRNFRNNHSEFVVFLTPYPGNASDLVHKIEKRQMNHRYHAMDKELTFSIMD